MEDLMFLWLADFRGDSQDPRHLGEFYVESYLNEGGPKRYNKNLTKPGPDIVKGSFEVALKNNTPDFQQIIALAKSHQPIRTAVLSIEKNFAGRSFGLRARYRMDGVVIQEIPRSYESHKISEVILSYEKLYLTKY